jgi:septum formation inhibitor MinC
MVELQDSHQNSEAALLLDISWAGNSAQACHAADEFVAHLANAPSGIMIDINAGDLLLTRGVLTKIKQQIQRAGAGVGIVYATLPQTQQAALDEGLFVKEKLTTGWTPLRQPLPLKKGNIGAQLPLKSKSLSAGEVNLPNFNAPQEAEITLEVVEVATQTSGITPDLPESTFESQFPEEQPEQPLEELERVLETEKITLTEGVFEALESGQVQVVPYPDSAVNTLYLRQTLRSGKTVRFNGNIVIVGDVHAGSEITAGGDIVVWGELRGIAHAGAQGNYKSEIRAMKIEALQLRIADYIARRPDRIYYHKDGAEHHALSPEVARVADGEIKIFKTMLPKG